MKSCLLQESRTLSHILTVHVQTRDSSDLPGGFAPQFSRSAVIQNMAVFAKITVTKKVKAEMQQNREIKLIQKNAHK